MPHVLKNDKLEVRIDLPGENYSLPRFDQTGKIGSVKFNGVQVSGIERTDTQTTDKIGMGFYNEFGIETAVGFDETKMGDWFHKIGVGLLKKEEREYFFHKDHPIKPAQFSWDSSKSKSLKMRCVGGLVNGFAYELQKEIKLLKDGFLISNKLKNTGSKQIQTDEYNHNFLAVDNELMGADYVLKFPFELKPRGFGEIVNSEQKVVIGRQDLTFSSTPNEQFFFSNLTGDKSVEATWELFNLNRKIGIRETGNFKTNKINLWGWSHVISPELFYSISILPGQTALWSRQYEIWQDK